MHRGFTLAELVVVFAIMAIMAVAVVPSYLQQGSRTSLTRSSSLLVQEIRTALEMSLAAREIEGSGQEFVPPGGYGVHIKATGNTYTAFLFADCNGDQKWNPAGESTCPTGQERLPDKTIELEEGVEIVQLLPGNPLDVVFVPPTPEVYINENSDATGQADITLQGSGGATKIVSVLPTGLIYTQ